MKQVEILANFEREINKLDDVISKPSTDDSLYWLNQGVYKFCKTRFNGNLPHLTSYEQNEKRSDKSLRYLPGRYESRSIQRSILGAF